MDNKKYSFSAYENLSIKALAIILMLMHHLFTFQEKIKDGAGYASMHVFKDGTNLEMHMGYFGKICVALFIAVSGYGLYKSYRIKNVGYDKFVVSRLKKVYSAFWKVFVIFVPLGLIIGAEKITTTPTDWIRNFLALDNSFNDEWWFLSIYILIVLMLPMLFTWLDRKKANMWKDLILITVFSTLVGTVILSYVRDNPYFASLNTTYYWDKMKVCLNMIPMFLMGAFLAKYEIIERLIAKLDKQWKIKSLGAVLLVVTYILRDGWRNMNAWGWDTFDYIYAAVLILSFACLIYKVSILQKVLSFIGKQATGIWLIHSFFCYYYFQSFIYSAKNPILILLLLLAVSFASAWIIDYVFGLLKKVIVWDTEKK